MNWSQTFHVTENPTIPGVYYVQWTIHGVIHPRQHDPELFAYFDGVNTWSAADFSHEAALRAKMTFKGIRPWTDKPRKYSSEDDKE